MMLQPHDHVLFFGDSITDAGRDRQSAPNDAAGWGTGFMRICAAELSARYPDWGLTFSNKGVSGDRVYDLEARLQRDVLDLRPSLVSILIGINDTWRWQDKGVASPVAEFAAAYGRIARAVQESGARLVICEPFLLPVPDDRRGWRTDFGPRLEACRDVAREAGALYLPLDGLFAAASCRRDAAFWLPDGVHPSAAGHALIARAWLQAVVG